jgi:hypothetical protein
MAMETEVEREDLDFWELGDRVWMWLQAENNQEMGFDLPVLWMHLKPVGAEL